MLVALLLMRFVVAFATWVHGIVGTFREIVLALPVVRDDYAVDGTGSYCQRLGT